MFSVCRLFRNWILFLLKRENVDSLVRQDNLDLPVNREREARLASLDDKVLLDLPVSQGEMEILGTKANEVHPETLEEPETKVSIARSIKSLCCSEMLQVLLLF